MRILGLDVGDRKIGVAMCDPDEILASPLTTIIKIDDSQVILQIKELIEKNKVGLIVVGIPYSLSGGESEQTIKTRDFARKLETALGIKILFQDERLSTQAAQRLIAGSGMKKSKGRSILDAAAATVLLQSYIDSSKNV